MKKSRKMIVSFALAAILVMTVPFTALARRHPGGGGHNSYGQCSVSNCNTSGNHQHNGVTYAGHHNGDGHNYHQNCSVSGCSQVGNHNHSGNQHNARCSVENCNITGVHQHNGTSYSGHYTGDGCRNHSAGDLGQDYPYCSYENCNLVGIHNHGGTTFCRDDYAAKFSDITGKDTWYYNAVDILTEMGIIAGTDEFSFSPNANVKRSEFTKLLFSLAETLGANPTQVNDIPFTDVPKEDYWATGYIGWAYENGIVAGHGNNIFKPHDSISRQDISVMMEKFIVNYLNAEIDQNTDITLSDSGKISPYAVNAVNYVTRSNLMQGYGNGVFGPQEYTPRSQTAQILFNLYSLLNQ